MNCDQAQDLLHRYAAGTLTPELRRSLEDHLAGCAACRAEAERVTPVLAGVARLPRSIEPPADLWPAISGRIGRAKVVDGRFGPAATRPWWTRMPVLAAAAVALVVVSSTVTVLMMRPSGGPAGVTGRPAAMSTDFLTVEAQYTRAADEILLALQQGEVRIAPETRAILERNLKVIDQAIAESRAALAGDPANAELRNMVLATYEHKLDLLRRVTYPKST